MRRLGRTLDKPTVVLVVAVVLLLLLALRVFLGPTGTQTSVDRNEVVRACGYGVLPEYREIAGTSQRECARTAASTRTDREGGAWAE